MPTSSLAAELFAQLAAPFTAEDLFDHMGDVVFFLKNWRGEYVVVNRTLMERCGCREKGELLGRRADQLFPAPLGASYRAQDESVLRNGRAILNQLELHFRASGGRGWCLTNKLPLLDRQRRVVGLVGTSRDLPSVAEGGADYAAVAAAVRHLQEHFDEPLRVTELARRAGLSLYQFEERIRRIFQLTAGQLLQKTRIEAALARLREPGPSIAGIALECGYSDQSAFTRKFRQTVGLSPREYRRTPDALPAARYLTSG